MYSLSTKSISWLSCGYKSATVSKKLLKLVSATKTVISNSHRLLKPRLSVQRFLVAEYASSALYVRRDDLNNAVTVNVDLDMEYYFSDMKKLDMNLKTRKMDNVLKSYAFYSEYRKLKTIWSKVQELEKERKEVAQRFAALNKEGKDDAQTQEIKNQLSNRGRELKDELKKIQSKWWELEESVVTAGLRLPVLFHDSTPEKDRIIREYGEKPDFKFNIKNHVELGQLLKVLRLSSISPGAFYLKGELAKLELDLLAKVSSFLTEKGFQQSSNSDFVKTVVVVLTLQAKRTDIEAHLKRTGVEELSEMDKWDITYHLCGAASLYSFAAYFTRMNIAQSSLPLKLFCSGRHYAAPIVEGQNGSPTWDMITAPQSNRVAVFEATTDKDQAYDLFKETREMLWELHQHFHLPIRLVEMAGETMCRSEAARSEVQVWMPSYKDYVKVASVSLCDDFFSRRLMMKYAKDPADVDNRNYVHTVHGTALNVPRIIAALIENYQTMIQMSERGNRCELEGAED